MYYKLKQTSVLDVIRVLKIQVVYLPQLENANMCNCYIIFRIFKASSPRGQLQNGLYCIRNSSTKPGKVTCNCWIYTPDPFLI